MNMQSAWPVQFSLDAVELRRIDAWWRACNYLSVGMIYLRENPLLKRPLAVAQINHERNLVIDAGARIEECDAKTQALLAPLGHQDWGIRSVRAYSPAALEHSAAQRQLTSAMVGGSVSSIPASHAWTADCCSAVRGTDGGGAAVVSIRPCIACRGCCAGCLYAYSGRAALRVLTICPEDGASEEGSI